MKIQMWFDKVSKAGDVGDKIKRKMEGIEKYLRHVSEDLKTGFVRLSRADRWGYKVKLGIKIPGQEVVAEAKETTLLSAFDRAYAKLSREVRKRLERLKEKRR